MAIDPRLIPLGVPVPIRVRMDAAGDPVEVLRLPIAAIRERWRIDDEWWRRPISRLYYEVVLENGRLLILYRDLVEGGWWRQ
jgi:hypothetical protein